MRPRLLKSLRIAVTAVSLLVCGLLIGLWVRSYAHPKAYVGQPASEVMISVTSYRGIADLTLHSPDATVEDHRPSKKWILAFHKDVFWQGFFIYTVRAPHWFLVTISATIAALPWIKWRFSLRTLLIVLTLFALFFGAIAMTL